MATHRAIDIDDGSHVNTPADRDESTHVNTLAAFFFGAIFLVLGMVGFRVSGGHHPIGSTGGHLIGLFEVNVLHNLVHLTIGVLMIVAAVAGTRSAKVVDVLVGVIYLATGAVGVFAAGTSLNILALNGADTTLHLAIGALMLAIGLFADRLRRPAARHA
jgi:hypothetical protein